MKPQIKTLDKMVSAAIYDGEVSTGDEIRTLAKSLRELWNYSVTDDEIEDLARELEARIGITMGLGAVLNDNDHEFVPWLNDAKSEMKTHFWDHYCQLLVSKQIPRDVVTATDVVTDRILGLLGNPNNPNPWDRRGMVVGHVQSGKTANYTGLICKAADAGYNFFVVIAGIHNNLRNQTQARIDEGFILRETGRKKSGGGRNSRMGGRVSGFNNIIRPVSLTTMTRDFNKTIATSIRGELGSFAVPLVLVIKKNAYTLRNLIDWLEEFSTQRSTNMVDQTLLLIDDEADNASININYGKDCEKISRINGQIRDLLNLFRRSSYVGYTATPFANIFIDPDQNDDLRKEDLFPKNFIFGLDAPKNYFGPNRVFLGDDSEDRDSETEHLRYITDNEDILPIKHKDDHVLDVLPFSLVMALRTFIIARTIRNLRGQENMHSTMLVNASWRMNVQWQLRLRLHEVLETIKDSVKVNAGLESAAALKDPEIAALHIAWQEEYSNCEYEWDEIQKNLLDTLRAAKVVEVNQRHNGLDYNEAGERGLTVIAVGGYSLSRGLTLEGLTVSYFLRNSMMYDSLMQMGRWFGYRPNYEDLCRIWMPYQAVEWYAHITEATNELFGELKRMENLRASPLDFGLAVRSHPDSLMVTARNKIGSGKKHVKIGLSNSYVETAKLTNRHEILEKNREAARKFLLDLEGLGFNKERGKHDDGNYLFRKVSSNVILDFLRIFINDQSSIATTVEPIREYIRNRVTELENWDVLVVSVKENDPKRCNNVLGWTLGFAERTVGPEQLKTNKILAIGRTRVSSGGIEKVGLDDDVVKEAEQRYFNKEGRRNFPDRIYREVRKYPLFVLYTIKVALPKGVNDEKLKALLPTVPVVAWCISFPKSKKPDAKVEYVINTTKFQEMYGGEDNDEEIYYDE